MPQYSKDNFETSGDRVISEEGLVNYIKGLPVLLFRIEMVKNRIEYLNDYFIEGLNEKTFLFLKNRNIAKELIVEDDHYLYDNFIQSVREAKPSLTVLRIKSENGSLRWLKLIGSPNSFNPGYYLGMIVDITLSIRLIEEMNRKEDEEQTMLELVDNPVVLVDMKSKAVVSHNSAALELFGYTFDEFRKLELNKLVDPGFHARVAEIFEEIIFEKKWKGKILFRRKGNSRFMGKASLRSLIVKKKRLLRISIYSFDFSDKKSVTSGSSKSSIPVSESRKIYMKSLLKKVDKLSDLKEILQTILDNPYKLEKFDGIIYSDIQIKKDRVVVYAAGDIFRNLRFGESFSYEGTIAENIESFKLDYLIVDDTMESIKAIDWALFTPYGVRSYYAKPFYERNVLRSILILCSKQVNFFSEENLDEYAVYEEPFIKGLKNWRKAVRSKNA